MTLNQRIGENTDNLLDYQEKINPKGDSKRITGKVLLLNKIPNLSIIEIICNNEDVINDILAKLSEDDVIVKTNLGLHIYADTMPNGIRLNPDGLTTPNDVQLNPNGSTDTFDTKVQFKHDNYVIRTMNTLDDAYVVMAHSRVRRNHKIPLFTYKFIRGSYDSILKRTVRDVLNDLGVLEAMSKERQDEMDKLLADINARKQQREKTIEKPKKKPKVQPKAIIIPLKANSTQKIAKIDLKDDFTMTSMIGKAENGKYINASEVVYDLSRVIRRIDGEVITFVKKIYDVHADKYILVHINQYNMKGMLKSIKLWDNDEKKITAWDVFEENMFNLTIKGIKFNSHDTDILSVFQDFKYDYLDTYDIDIINDFLSLIREVICDNNEEMYKYVVSWIANIIQNPGLKNETALILKGLQGTGKNTFTNVICELLAGYAAMNITDISELTGNFNSVVESKMLIVLNELSNCSNGKQINFNTLKSIITDNTIRINEKNQPRRTAENVANFIFITNNSFPVKIEAGDRRYVVMSVNAKHKGDIEYFTKLHKSFTKEFYDNLLTYFFYYNINDFNPRNIPMSEAKQDIIEASCSEFDEWINNHYLALIEGMLCSEALACKPSGMKDKIFQLQIKDKCYRKQKRMPVRREWYYVLKEECYDLYHQTTNDN